MSLFFYDDPNWLSRPRPIDYDIIERLKNEFHTTCYTVEDIRIYDFHSQRSINKVVISLGVKSLEEAIYYINNLDWDTLKYANKQHKFTDEQIEMLQLIKEMV